MLSAISCKSYEYTESVVESNNAYHTKMLHFQFSIKESIEIICNDGDMPSSRLCSTIYGKNIRPNLVTLLYPFVEKYKTHEKQQCGHNTTDILSARVTSGFLPSHWGSKPLNYTCYNDEKTCKTFHNNILEAVNSVQGTHIQAKTIIHSRNDVDSQINAIKTTSMRKQQKYQLNKENKLPKSTQSILKLLGSSISPINWPLSTEGVSILSGVTENMKQTHIQEHIYQYPTDVIRVTRSNIIKILSLLPYANHIMNTNDANCDYNSTTPNSKEGSLLCTALQFLLNVHRIPPFITLQMKLYIINNEYNANNLNIILKLKLSIAMHTISTMTSNIWNHTVCDVQHHNAVNQSNIQSESRYLPKLITASAISDISITRLITNTASNEYSNNNLNVVIYVIIPSIQTNKCCNSTDVIDNGSTLIKESICSKYHDHDSNNNEDRSGYYQTESYDIKLYEIMPSFLKLLTHRSDLSDMIKVKQISTLESKLDHYISSVDSIDAYDDLDNIIDIKPKISHQCQQNNIMNQNKHNDYTKTPYNCISLQFIGNASNVYRIEYSAELLYPSREHHSADPSRGRELPPTNLFIKKIYKNADDDDDDDDEILLMTVPLLLRVPIPDFSMPFNVITLSSTALAFLAGLTINAIFLKKVRDKAQK